MSIARSTLFSCQQLPKLWFPVEGTVSLSGTQFIRWRKGRWVPVAKSKQFFIPKKRVIPEEEPEEVKRLFNNYRTAMKAIREHLKQENLRTSATSVLASQQAAEEEDEHRKLMEFNLQENARVAALREQRLHQEREADYARVRASVARHEEREAEQKAEAVRIITEAQELVKSFIRREDLEKAIEAAIENPTDFNFAINAEGQIFEGRRTNPEVAQEKQRMIGMGQ